MVFSRTPTRAVFRDLTAAYDTAWHIGLLLKLSKSLPRWFVEKIENFLHNRRFRVHMGDKSSSWKTETNGFPKDQSYLLAYSTSTLTTFQLHNLVNLHM